MSEDFGTSHLPGSPDRHFSPRVEELDDEAREFLAEALEVARVLGLPENMQHLSTLFGERRRQWYDSPESDRPDPNDFVTAVSVLVGQRLAHALSLDWVRYTDDDGTALALLAPAEKVHERQNLYIFPIDGVGARWPMDAEGEVLDYYEGVLAYVREQLRGPGSGRYSTDVG